MPSEGGILSSCISGALFVGLAAGIALGCHDQGADTVALPQNVAALAADAAEKQAHATLNRGIGDPMTASRLLAAGESTALSDSGIFGARRRHQLREALEESRRRLAAQQPQDRTSTSSGSQAQDGPLALDAVQKPRAFYNTMIEVGGGGSCWINMYHFRRRDVGYRSKTLHGCQGT